jgi:hypothetical protein
MKAVALQVDALVSAAALPPRAGDIAGTAAANGLAGASLRAQADVAAPAAVVHIVAGSARIWHRVRDPGLSARTPAGAARTPAAAIAVLAAHAPPLVGNAAVATGTLLVATTRQLGVGNHAVGHAATDQEHRKQDLSAHRPSRR